jgi:hypothetical protein
MRKTALLALVMLLCLPLLVTAQQEGGGGETANPWGCPGLSACQERCATQAHQCGSDNGATQPWTLGTYPTCDAKYEACMDMCRETECFPVY